MNKHQAICTEGKGGGERKECGQQQDNEQAYRREEEPGSSLDEYLDNPPDIKLWPETRQNCVRCGKRSRLYCSDCLLFVGTPTGVKTPTDHLRLPLQVDILVTAKERQRSSGVHVAVVAPQSVRVVLFEEAKDGLPSYQPERDLVVFPSETSICWSDLSKEDLAAARRIILIDSRWVKTGAVVGHPKLKGLRHIRICNPPTVSRFWRWHIEGEGHICTAEATYLVLKEFEEVSGLVTQGGRLEDLLFLFALVGSRIKNAYESDPSKMGMDVPSSEEAKLRRRLRFVRLDRLVKTKYKGLDAVREKDGDEAAIEEFFRRRRGESVYHVTSTKDASCVTAPAELLIEGAPVGMEDTRRAQSAGESGASSSKDSNDDSL